MKSANQDANICMKMALINLCAMVMIITHPLRTLAYGRIFIFIFVFFCFFFFLIPLVTITHCNFCLIAIPTGFLEKKMPEIGQAFKNGGFTEVVTHSILKKCFPFHSKKLLPHPVGEKKYGQKQISVLFVCLFLCFCFWLFFFPFFFFFFFFFFYRFGVYDLKVK